MECANVPDTFLPQGGSVGESLDNPQQFSVGLTEGDSLTGLKTQTQEQRATLKRQNLHHFEDQGGGALVGEGHSKGLKTHQQPGLWSHKVSLVIGVVLTKKKKKVFLQITHLQYEGDEKLR